MKWQSMAYILLLIIALSTERTEGAPWEKYDEPVPTKITVRILAHGAKAMYPKFGARVTIRDAETNEILDEGEVQGSSGDTEALMKTGFPRTFGQYGLQREDQGIVASERLSQGVERLLPLTPENLAETNVEAVSYSAKDDAAQFVGKIHIAKPTVIRIEAVGPLKYKQATMSDTITTLVLPGHDIEGEGIVLNIRGLVVDILSPNDGDTVKVSGKKEVNVSFKMNMMCGCPILENPDNPWQPGMYTFYIEAYYDGKLYYDEKISAREIITGMSTFSFPLPLPLNLHKESKKLKLRLMAAQTALANYGMDEAEFILK